MGSNGQGHGSGIPKFSDCWIASVLPKIERKKIVEVFQRLGLLEYIFARPKKKSRNEGTFQCKIKFISGNFQWDLMDKLQPSTLHIATALA